MVGSPKGARPKSNSHKAERRKVRVTTFIDRDAVMWLKVRALEERIGYQTLLNRLLRAAISEEGAEKESPRVTRAEFLKAAEELSRLMVEVRRLRDAHAEAERSAHSKAERDARGRGKTVRLRVYKEIPHFAKKPKAREKPARITGVRTQSKGKASASSKIEKGPRRRSPKRAVR